MIWIALAFLIAVCVVLVVTRSMGASGYIALGCIVMLVGLLIPFTTCQGRGCYPAASNMLAWPFVTIAYVAASLGLSRRLRRIEASWPREIALWSLLPLVTLAVCSLLILEDGFGIVPHLWAAVAPAFAVLVVQGWRMGGRNGT
jgi:hypothetical protein